MGAVCTAWDTPSLLFPFPTQECVCSFPCCPASVVSLLGGCALLPVLLCAIPLLPARVGFRVLFPPSLPPFLFLCSACLLCAPLPVLCLCRVSPVFLLWFVAGCPCSLLPSLPPLVCVCVRVCKTLQFPRRYSLIHHHAFLVELHTAQIQDFLDLMSM